VTGRSQKEKLWLVGGALGVVLLAALSWLLVVSPQLSNAASLRSQTDDAATMNLMLQSQVGDLRAQSHKLAAVQGQLDAEHAALPGENGIDSFTQQLASEASASHVKITSVVAAQPSAASGSSTSPPASGAATGANPAGQLFAIQVTVVSDGPVKAQQAFLKAIQTGPRAALVISTGLGAATTSAVRTLDAVTTMTVQVKVFVAPGTPAASGPVKQAGA
jgi:type IV pilus assembly protein PilO